MSQCVHGILGIALGFGVPRAEGSAKREVAKPSWNGQAASMGGRSGVCFLDTFPLPGV